MTLLLILEAVFGLIATVLAIIIAKAYAGGTIARAVKLIAIGSGIMAIGHIVLALDLIYTTNIFGKIFGDAGAVIFRIVVLISLVSTVLGFGRLWRSSVAIPDPVRQ